MSIGSSSRVHGQWLEDFRCVGCDKDGPASAVVIGEDCWRTISEEDE